MNWKRGLLTLFLSIYAAANMLGCSPSPEVKSSGRGGAFLDDVVKAATSIPTNTPAPTFTPTPEPTATPYVLEECNYSLAFIEDVTIPDGTIFDSAQEFTKTWLVQNNSDCDIVGAQLAYLSGSNMEGKIIEIPEIRRGEQAEISVDLKSPGLSGQYFSNWRPLIIEEDKTTKLGDDLWASIIVQGEAVIPKFIVVYLDQQRLCYYLDSKLQNCYAVSTGIASRPTPIGEFRIWHKERSQTMSGPGYSYDGVEFVMYFHEGYGIHEADWHDNFGTPMSSGCVNMRRDDAKTLFYNFGHGDLVYVLQNQLDAAFLTK